MGTPDYIAPEQAVDARTADIRADVYSLGCTLYHLLTGRVPFPGGTLTEKLLRHQQAEPDAIERLCPDVAPGLARVVRRMMAKRPQDRYQTPGEVAGALVPFASPAAALPEALAAPTAESLRGSDTPTKTWAPRGAERRDDAPPLRPASGPHPWPGRRLLRAGRRSCSCPMAGVRDAAGPASAAGPRHLPALRPRSQMRNSPAGPTRGNPLR